MRGFGVWHLRLHLRDCMALCLCAFVFECRPYFLASLWGCMGQRVGLCVVWGSNRAFTLASLLRCKVFVSGREGSVCVRAVVSNSSRWNKLRGSGKRWGWMKGKEETRRKGGREVDGVKKRRRGDEHKEGKENVEMDSVKLNLDGWMLWGAFHTYFIWTLWTVKLQVWNLPWTKLSNLSMMKKIGHALNKIEPWFSSVCF